MLGETGLDLLLIKEFSTELKSKRKSLLEHASILLQLLSVSLLEFSKSIGVFSLSSEEIIVPLLIELLVLLDVSLLAIFSLLGLHEDQLLVSSVVVLESELGNPVFGHLSLDVLALVLASLSVLLESFAKSHQISSKPTPQLIVHLFRLSILEDTLGLF